MSFGHYVHIQRARMSFFFPFMDDFREFILSLDEASCTECFPAFCISLLLFFSLLLHMSPSNDGQWDSWKGNAILRCMLSKYGCIENTSQNMTSISQHTGTDINLLHINILYILRQWPHKSPAGFRMYNHFPLASANHPWEDPQGQQ